VKTRNYETVENTVLPGKCGGRLLGLFALQEGGVR
jgi:hypothetical protein